ncbi:MAG TPA: DUF6427 family protein [Bacteroidales bacterium]
MFRLFSRLGIFIQLIVVLGVATLLVLPAFSHSVALLPVRDDFMLHSLIIKALNVSPIIGVSIAPSILLFQAFFLYFLAISNDLHPRDSLLTILFYFILAASLTESIIFSAALAASVLLLISLFFIVKMQGSTQTYKQIFSASFCVSVAALFYPPAIIFVLFIWLSFLTYRIASWHEWVISFLAFMIPVLYLFTYYLWIGQLQLLFTNYNSLFSNLTNEFPKFRLWQMIFLGFTSVLLLLALFRQITLIQDKLISIRRKTWIFIDFMIIAALSCSLSGRNFPGHLSILAIPGALFLANMYTGKRVNWTFEIFSVLMLMLLLIARFSI